MKWIKHSLKKFFKLMAKQYHDIQQARQLVHTYRVVEIYKNEHDEYEVQVQVSGKSVTFKSKPEEILADDKLVDQFSQRDVRTLTYLGYVDLNSPKYKILSKQHSPELQQMLFALHKKGEKKYTVKTAAEISTDETIMKHLDQKDAHMVGFTTANEQMLIEEQQKAEARKLFMKLETKELTDEQV